MNVKLTKRELVISLTIIILTIFIIGKLFYGSFIAGFMILPLAVPIFLIRKKKLLDKKIEEMEKQFMDMLVSVSDAISTGYSIENAIKESYRDLVNIYGYDSNICQELRLMLSRIKLNVSVEKALEDFASRSCLENAKIFSQIFSVAKKTGGNIRDIIKDVTDNIVLKQTVKNEIVVAISEKKLEQSIMSVVPIFLIVYVNMSSKGFLDIMYDTFVGRIVMTICLIAYIAAYFWSEKVMEMEI